MDHAGLIGVLARRLIALHDAGVDVGALHAALREARKAFDEDRLDDAGGLLQGLGARIEKLGRGQGVQGQATVTRMPAVNLSQPPPAEPAPAVDPAAIAAAVQAALQADLAQQREQLLAGLNGIFGRLDQLEQQVDRDDSGQLGPELEQRLAGIESGLRGDLTDLAGKVDAAAQQTGQTEQLDGLRAEIAALANQQVDPATWATMLERLEGLEHRLEEWEILFANHGTDQSASFSDEVPHDPTLLAIADPADGHVDAGDQPTEQGDLLAEAARLDAGLDGDLQAMVDAIGDAPAAASPEPTAHAVIADGAPEPSVSQALILPDTQVTALADQDKDPSGSGWVAIEVDATQPVVRAEVEPPAVAPVGDPPAAFAEPAMGSPGIGDAQTTGQQAVTQETAAESDTALPDTGPQDSEALTGAMTEDAASDKQLEADEAALDQAEEADADPTIMTRAVPVPAPNGADLVPEQATTGDLPAEPESEAGPEVGAAPTAPSTKLTVVVEGAAADGDDHSVAEEFAPVTDQEPAIAADDRLAAIKEDVMASPPADDPDSDMILPDADALRAAGRPPTTGTLGSDTGTVPDTGSSAVITAEQHEDPARLMDAVSAAISAPIAAGLDALTASTEDEMSEPQPEPGTDTASLLAAMGDDAASDSSAVRPTNQSHETSALESGRPPSTRSLRRSDVAGIPAAQTIRESSEEHGRVGLDPMVGRESSHGIDPSALEVPSRPSTTNAMAPVADVDGLADVIGDAERGNSLIPSTDEVGNEDIDVAAVSTDVSSASQPKVEVVPVSSDPHEFRRQLLTLLPDMLRDPVIKQHLFAVIATEALVNPSALGELTGLRKFVRRLVEDEIADEISR